MNSFTIFMLLAVVMAANCRTIKITEIREDENVKLCPAPGGYGTLARIAKKDNQRTGNALPTVYGSNCKDMLCWIVCAGKCLKNSNNYCYCG